MHQGVYRLLKAKEYKPGFECSMEKYIKCMCSKKATHVGHAGNIYNETFHHTIGEGVESTGNVRPYGRKWDSVKATETTTESNGTNGNGIETTDGSFRSDSDELETD